MDQIPVCISKIADKICAIFSTAAGWILSLFAWFFAFLGDEKWAFYAVVGAIIWDMIWGIAVSRKRHERFFLSYLARETCMKFMVYIGTLFLALCIERGLNDSWGLGFRIFCGLAAACELWSASASILIIKPDLPFLRLLRTALTGEIASKLNVSTEEVEEILFKDNKTE